MGSGLCFVFKGPCEASQHTVACSTNRSSTCTCKQSMQDAVSASTMHLSVKMCMLVCVESVMHLEVLPNG
jgi:hypothetical protein